MANEIVQVQFHGDFLDAVRDDRGVWVGVKRACENVGLDEAPQRKKLQRAGWATAAMKAAVAEDGKSREMFMVHLDCLPMWLATIEASRVKPAIRQKLIDYQKECARVLREHFFPAREHPSIGIETMAAVVGAAMAPITTMMGQILDRMQSRSLDSDNTIGSRGASIVRKKLLDYARDLAPTDHKLQRSLRSAAEMDVRVAVGHTGTGRTWSSLPSSKWSDLTAKLQELDRLAGRIGTRQLSLCK